MWNYDMGWWNIEYILDNLCNERARTIYVLRLERIKYKEIAQYYKISIPRARQIFERTDSDVKHYLEKFKDMELWNELKK